MMPAPRVRNWLAALCGLACGASAALADELPPAATRPVDFAADIQPLLTKHCHECHGEKQQESNFRLDVKAAALGTGDFGDPPIVPGKGAESPLVLYAAHQEEGLEMPPAKTGRRLSAEEVGLLRAWIDQGANWPDELAGEISDKITTDHWSFQPVTRPDPPTGVPGAGAIDAFVLQKLTEAGLTPAAEADRVTLIRRLYLDMHGLLPTGEQVAEFVNDAQPGAYERLVDRVLASPHYGERWARHWLDVVRFAESDGFEMNHERPNAYHYRDYVIATFNEDKPYDQFIIEQLAGDATGAPAATGFIVGGAYDKVKGNLELNLMQRQDELTDMVNTTGTAFLGLTMSCARCHNHKFDPILQKDFYAMQAIFAGVSHGDRALAKPDDAKTQGEIAAVDAELAGVDAELARLGLVKPINAERNVEIFPPHPARFVRFNIAQTSSGSEPCVDELEIYTVAGEEAESRNVALAAGGAKATASGSYQGAAIHQLAHINDGRHGNNFSWISSTAGQGWVQIELPETVTIDRIVWGRDRERAYSDRMATAYKVEIAIEPDQWQVVVDSTERNGNLSDEARAQVEKLQAIQKALSDKRAALVASRNTAVYAGNFSQPGVTKRLYRGDPMSPREPVAPDALTVTGSLELDEATPERERRLALARWIASRDNPLTARVLVNRLWHYHFGVGLVDTPSDFGANGTQPTHPELLDWMASELMQHDWSIKHMQRLILLSSTYRQASAPRADCAKVDAACRLLWRFPPRRLEAEAIRDCALQLAGTLDKRMGGPGYSVFEPNSNYVRNYVPKEKFGPAEWRRMVYMQRIRMERDAVFGVFDCPDGGQIAPKRPRSTTALQALNLLNSQFLLDQADLLAKRLQTEAGAEPAAQIERVFQLAYHRAPDEVELKASQELIAAHGLPILCRAILNSNELLFLP